MFFIGARGARSSACGHNSSNRKMLNIRFPLLFFGGSCQGFVSLVNPRETMQLAQLQLEGRGLVELQVSVFTAVLN